ncbi:hypothetical protein [Nocardioides taihuensis]|uniref:ABC-2 type transport system permease protein n=1 Tax=Nocardioides taihuensis TaxID=1835606 RepID=A0ABW0BGJ0_9ACTN
MPTAASSTERRTQPHEPTWWDPVRDVGHLLRFRAGTTGRRRGVRIALVAGLLITLGAAVVPAFTPGAGGSGRAFDMLILLPTLFAGFLALAVVSAVVSGGGRELIGREQAVAYPISPTTDHLGALLLAPVNIAWLLQAWVLLGVTSYAVPRDQLVPAQVVVVLWLVVATALAQVIAWSGEAVRRRPSGQLAMRALAVLVGATAAALQLTHRLTSTLDLVPTKYVVTGALGGFSWGWALTTLLLLVILVSAIVAGSVPANRAARRLPHDEARVESGARTVRPLPRSDLAAFLRIDRASVWRAVPMRRGMFVLAVGPGLVAIAGDLPWTTMTVLPGLVASGGALLFGVNAWCLDGRGGLWRESLPVGPRTVFVARSLVLAEFLALASLITIVLASLRAGLPTTAELTALLATWLVVTVQVVSAAMRWSAQRPYSVDLRSARATPAPPLMMVAYSSRLAVSTTLTGLVFSGLAHVPAWQVSVLVALPFLLWSSVRLMRSETRWADPVQRARVVMTVTG